MLEGFSCLWSNGTWTNVKTGTRCTIAPREKPGSYMPERKQLTDNCATHSELTWTNKNTYVIYILYCIQNGPVQSRLRYDQNSDAVTKGKKQPERNADNLKLVFHQLDGFQQTRQMQRQSLYFVSLVSLLRLRSSVRRSRRWCIRWRIAGWVTAVDNARRNLFLSSETPGHNQFQMCKQWDA
jgi:hypothetical protein